MVIGDLRESYLIDRCLIGHARGDKYLQASLGCFPYGMAIVDQGPSQGAPRFGSVALIESFGGCGTNKMVVVLDQ